VTERRAPQKTTRYRTTELVVHGGGALYFIAPARNGGYRLFCRVGTGSLMPTGAPSYATEEQARKAAYRYCSP
jgi:hypothetical protein